MMDRSFMSGTPDCGSDAAAYALGALEPGEADAFRRHMQECTVCRDEVEALAGVVSALPLATTQYEAPRGLRRRVMREVRREPVARASSRRRALWPSPLSVPWRGSRQGMTGLALAAAAVAGVVIAVALPRGGPAVTVYQARVSGVAGSAQLRVSSGRADLEVHHLSPPGRGHTYEVWLQSGTAAPVPASVLFGVNGSGDADVGIPHGIRGVSAVMVTPEPLGGSPHPTHAPVIVARLA
jgi:anti-sigma-K factor RskA